MKSEFTTKPLSALADIQTGPFGSQLHKEDYVQTGTPIVTVEHLGQKRFTEQNLPCVSEIDKERLSKYILREGDVVFSRVGSVDRCSYVSREYNGWMFSGRCLRVRPCIEIDSQYLYYYFTLESTKQFVRGIATGATMPSINTKFMGEVPIAYPPIDEQRKIATVLSALDNKIELNDKINNNLAEQSQAIFAEFMCKYPYVLSPLGDMAEIIDCLHSKKPKSVNDTTYQLLQLNNITDSGFLDLSSKYYISKSDYENWTRKCEIVEGDCVITNVGRIGAVSQAPNGTHAAMGRNMTCIRLRKDKPFYSYLITALLSPHIRREIMKNTDEGTIMGALNVKNIPLLLFPMFAPPTMNALEDLLSPIRKAIEQNYLSNQTLSLLRDSLLPRLMSGELDASNIEI